MSYESAYTIKRNLRKRLIVKIIEREMKCDMEIVKIEFGEVEQRTTNTHVSIGKHREGKMKYVVYYKKINGTTVKPSIVRFTINTHKSRIIEVLEVWFGDFQKYKELGNKCITVK